MWYGAGRIGLDFLRTDPIRAFGMTGTQLASVVLVPAVLLWLAARARRGARIKASEDRRELAPAGAD